MQRQDEYRNTAAIYDLLFSRALRDLRSQICTVIAHIQAKSIIDLCCGTGEQLRMLAGDAMLLTGVDLSPAMLATARGKGPDGIHYLEADASALPLPDGHHDGVIISFGLHEKTATQQRGLFREGCRLLQPGGHLLIADYSCPPPGMTSQLMGRILIPALERAAGINHYRNYREWMESGAVEAFLEKNSPGKITLVAPHFHGCAGIYMVSMPRSNPLPAAIKEMKSNRTGGPSPQEEESP